MDGVGRGQDGPASVGMDDAVEGISVGELASRVATGHEVKGDSPLERQMGLLGAAVADVDGEVRLLVERLEPMLGSAVPEEPGEEVRERVGDSLVVCRLGELELSVRAVAMVVREARGRLEA